MGGATVLGGANDRFMPGASLPCFPILFKVGHKLLYLKVFVLLHGIFNI